MTTALFNGLQRIAARVRRWTPAAARQRRHLTRERAMFEAQLAALAPRLVEPGWLGDGDVLVDGTFDNPNYWLRYGLLRAAAGLRARREVGLIGRFRRPEAAATFERLGIIDTIDSAVASRPFRDAAARLIAATKDAADILRWQLPLDFPGAIVFDGLLKRQRTATVDLRHPRLVEHVAEALADLDFAARTVSSSRWSLFALSHAINFSYGALAWAAARSGIPVIVCFGNYGTPRYWRVDRPAEIDDSVDRPTGAMLDGLPPETAAALEATGRAYLERRLGGRTDDVGSIYAFQRNASRMTRAEIVEALGWPADRPIVTVYASNWFDFPHAAGMTQFRDFLEWIEVTLAAAADNRGVSWLFRAHPCDQWYGGQTLSDVMPANCGEHIKLCPTQWHGADVLRASDAVVTVHGTVGIEAPMVGIPALVADVGWYHDCGFARWPRTAHEYRSLLGTNWWVGVDATVASRRAGIFAGIYFGNPSWQSPLISGDDSEQGALYPRLAALIADRPAALDREIETIGRWLVSGERFYHTFKMRQATSYAVAS